MSERGPSTTALRVLLALGLVAIALAAAVVLLQSAPRRSGTNLTTDSGPVVPLPGAQQLCEPGELLPADTGSLQLNAQPEGGTGPALGVAIAGPDGRVLSRGKLAEGWKAGTIRLPVQRMPNAIAGATVCIRNLGARYVRFGGSMPDAEFTVTLAGKVLYGRMRIEYMRPGSESWLALAPTIAHRMSLAKSDLVRHWAAFAAILLMLLAIALASRTILREVSS